MNGRILVTPRSLSKCVHAALTPLVDAGYELVFPAPGATPDQGQLASGVSGCVGWLAGVEPVSEEVIEAADALRVISRNGTGVDNLPMQAIEAKGIVVRRAEGTNARSVAELALALALAGMRDIVQTNFGIVAGAWPRRIGREILGSKVSVIGLGAIGATFAQFALALGAEVSGHDPFAPEDLFAGSGLRRLSFEKTMAGAEVLSLHAPMQADGSPLIGEAELSVLAKGAVVVNTARAGLVHAEAMLAALDSGQVSAYAVDVFETEPPPPSPLLSHPRVILTSHIGGFTHEAVDRCTQIAVSNMLEVLDETAH